MGCVGDEFGRGSQGLMLVVVVHARESGMTKYRNLGKASGGIDQVLG